MNVVAISNPDARKPHTDNDWHCYTAVETEFYLLISINIPTAIPAVTIVFKSPVSTNILLVLHYT